MASAQSSPMARLKATMAALERLFGAPIARPALARPADTRVELNYWPCLATLAFAHPKKI